MTEHLQELSGNGQLSVGGGHSQVGYKLVAKEEPGGRVSVSISVMAPRDWLLKQGFRTEAVLQRGEGEDLRVAFDGELDVTDPISVTLSAQDRHFGSIDEARSAFPELGQMRA